MANNGHDSSRVPLKIPTTKIDKKFPTMLRIIFSEGGTVPEVLSGLYNKKSAKRAIDDWVDGYSRPKIYPRAPVNDIPQRLSLPKNKVNPIKVETKVKADDEEKRIS